MSDPIPVLGWDASDAEWLTARRNGIGASEVSAVLGLSRYTTPYQVWLEKTGRRIPEALTGEAIELGHSLELWLLDQAGALLSGKPSVKQTPHRLYEHPTRSYRRASPDGEVVWGDNAGDLVECKTAGLAGGWGTPEGWTEDSIPLGYQLQAHWQMHVMNRPRVHVVALVAGMGRCLYTIERDAVLERDLVDQVHAWWQRHIVDGEEPAIGGGDSSIIAELFPVSNNEAIDLSSTDLAELAQEYRREHEQESIAKKAKKGLATRIKALLGEYESGWSNGKEVATWKPRIGNVEWRQVLADLAEKHAFDPPTDDDLNAWRKPATREIDVKEIR